MNILDVAKLAGVSITTVSRVINKVSTVKEINRIKVEEAIKKLGYRPSVVAQLLAGAESHTIGLIIPPFRDMFGSFFVSETIKGVAEEARLLKLGLLLHITHERIGKDLYDDDILNPGLVGGIIFADINGNQKLLKRLSKERIPYVVMNNYFRDEPINCVGVDNEGSAFKVVKYLAGLGHKSIATITGNLTTAVGRMRLEGFKKGLESCNIEPMQSYIVEGNFSEGKSGYDGMQKLLALKPRPTAVFVASDEMAREAIRACTDKGLKLPEDVSIVGFDDSFVSTQGPVPLTTIHQPLYEMGKKAVEVLYQITFQKKKEPVKVSLSTRLVKRDSCARR